jgi:hypothetical protein
VQVQRLGRRSTSAGARELLVLVGTPSIDFPGSKLLYVNTGMQVFGHDAILGQEGEEGWGGGEP